MDPHPTLSETAAKIVRAAQAASPTLRLVGGAGLAMLLGHRRSDDLDLFCAPREDIRPILSAIEVTVETLGGTTTRV